MAKNDSKKTTRRRTKKTVNLAATAAGVAGMATMAAPFLNNAQHYANGLKGGDWQGLASRVIADSKSAAEPGRVFAAAAPLATYGVVKGVTKMLNVRAPKLGRFRAF